MSKCISCEWKNDELVIVNPDGQVFPCCYLSNMAYKFDNTDIEELYKGKESKNKHIMKKYMDNKDDYNIYKNPLSKILKGKWFDETLPQSWENYDNAYYKCKKYCTVNKDD